MLHDQNIGLFDLLVGRFVHVSEPPDLNHEGFEGYFDTYPPDERIRISILENLTRVFQTQAGMVPHLEDFGVPPDIWKIYSRSNDGPATVEDLIRRTVEKYEPRIKVEEVRVEKLENEGVDSSLLSLTVRIVGQVIGASEGRTILTEFSPAGFVRVAFDEGARG